LGGQRSQYSQVFLLLECGDCDVHIVKAGNQKFKEYPLAVMLQKGKVVLVHAMKAFKPSWHYEYGIMDIAVLILTLSAR